MNRINNARKRAALAVTVMLLTGILPGKALAAPVIRYQEAPFLASYEQQEGYLRYKELYPKASVKAQQVAGDWSETEDYLQNHLVGRLSSPDIFHTDAKDYSLQAIMKKEYYLPIDGAEDFARSLYPAIRDFIMQGDQVAMIPLRADLSYYYQLNPEIMEEIGLTQEELPTNFIELLSFAREWPERYGQDFPQYHAFFATIGGFELRQRNFTASLMMKSYLYTSLKAEGKVVYDTPLFRSLLDAIDPFTQRAEDQGDDYMSEDPQWGQCLIYVTNGEPFSFRRMKLMTPLPLDRQSATVQPVELFAAHLNPFGENARDARELVELFAGHPAPVLARMIGSDRSPLENPEFKTLSADLTRIIQQTEAEILKIQSKDTLSGQDEIRLKNEKMVLKDMESRLENARYTISQEEIALYNTRLAPWLYVCGSSPYESAGFSQQADKLMAQYLDGSLPRERLISQLDNVVRLMALENQ